MSTAGSGPVVAGIDVGGTATNATILGLDGTFLVGTLLEVPSRVTEGPAAAIDAIGEALDAALVATGRTRDDVVAVGLGTPGPASAAGVLSSRGATNFGAPAWHGFDIRTAVETALDRPVVYSNDGNAAALYAHRMHFGTTAGERSSVAAIVGTGLGGGVVVAGTIVTGAAGMAGELGHVPVPMEGILAPGQPLPRCNCGAHGDVESVASLTGLAANLLPYWLTRYLDHPLHDTARVSITAAAREVRALAQRGDEMARAIFTQQAAAIGALFTIAARFTDPDAYFVGGGVTEGDPSFRAWFLDTVRAHTDLQPEQRGATIAVVPDRDMAGARGAGLAALQTLNGRGGPQSQDNPC